MSDEQKYLVNTYDQLVAAVTAKLIPKKHAVAISYQAYQARIAGGGTHAWSPFFQTDPRPDCAWYHHHKKAFYGDRMSDRADAAEKAKAWVRETYGYAGEWKRNAFRDWVPAIVQETFPIPRRPKFVQSCRPVRYK